MVKKHFRYTDFRSLLREAQNAAPLICHGRVKSDKNRIAYFSAQYKF